MTEVIKAWWFSDNSGKLPHGDNRPIIVGEKLSVKGKIVLCRNGFHGSEHPFDALQYASGYDLNRTLHDGTILKDNDKLCSEYRTIIIRKNIEKELWSF